MKKHAAFQSVQFFSHWGKICEYNWEQYSTKVGGMLVISFFQVTNIHLTQR